PRTGRRRPLRRRGGGLVSSPPPRLGFGLRSADAQPAQFIVKLDPSTGVRLELDARLSQARRVGSIHLDMEFADEGGEGATPYEVLLHAAMVGQTVRFTQQDGVEEQWRGLEPPIGNPPPGLPHAPGCLGPRAPSG